MSSPADKYHRRGLDAGYKHYGRALSLAGVDSPQIGIVEVRDNEETAEGARVESLFRGYTLRLRRYLLPEGFEPVVHSDVTLADPLYGHSDFVIQSGARKHGRRGDQWVIPLAVKTQAPSGGPYPFADDA